MLQLDQLKRQHADEMADMVREHNKKYSAMLSQQLNEQDALKEQLEKVNKVLTPGNYKMAMSIYCGNSIEDCRRDVCLSRRRCWKM